MYRQDCIKVTFRRTSSETVLQKIILNRVVCFCNHLNYQSGKLYKFNINLKWLINIATTFIRKFQGLNTCRSMRRNSNSNNLWSA